MPVQEAELNFEVHAFRAALQLVLEREHPDAARGHVVVGRLGKAARRRRIASARMQMYGHDPSANASNLASTLGSGKAKPEADAEPEAEAEPEINGHGIHGEHSGSSSSQQGKALLASVHTGGRAAGSGVMSSCASAGGSQGDTYDGGGQSERRGRESAAGFSSDQESQEGPGSLGCACCREEGDAALAEGGEKEVDREEVEREEVEAAAATSVGTMMPSGDQAEETVQVLEQGEAQGPRPDAGEELPPKKGDEEEGEAAKCGSSAGCGGVRQLSDEESPRAAAFVEYAQQALARLSLPPMGKQGLVDTWQEVEPLVRLVGSFWTLRAVLAPVLESLILLDRLLYLQELEAQDASRMSRYSCNIIPIFLPELSPRNMALVGLREDLAK
eukprot:jgi/Mesen1/201/ME1138501C07586